ncbi:MAG: tripartite tricarboxylate transporter TctB family protein [Hyphomicrobiales bacterium]|nr:tripartite tricarboxylate transporter TctB family protein [Hyphomicrobiales bacterium]
MNGEFLHRKDLWSGLMLIAIGGGALFIARNYEFGSSLRMGPGYFPTALGALLVLFGIYLVIQNLRSGTERIEGSWSLRALIVLPLSLVLFGLLIDRAGFIPAMLVLIIGSASASAQFRLMEVLLFAVALTALCVVVFVWTLGLPYQLIAGFW